MTIKVGIDYDEPVHPWYRLAHLASVEAGIAVPGREPTTWAPHEEYNCELDAWVKVLDDEVLKGDGGMYAHPLDEVVKWQFQRLSDLGAEVHIVTARGSFGELKDKVKDITLRQVEREGLQVAGVHFGKDKVPIIQELDLDYMIDDSPSNFEAITYETDADTYLLDAPWNQDVETDYRVKSLEEFVDIIVRRHAPLPVR